MARKPNYAFERKERERLKADKKARRAGDKREAQERKAEQREPSVRSDDRPPGDGDATPSSED
jgi:hypothetical protein